MNMFCLNMCLWTNSDFKGRFFFFWNDLSFQAIRISKINYLNIQITEVQGDWCSCKGKYILKILHQGVVLKPIPKMVFQYWSMRIMSNTGIKFRKTINKRSHLNSLKEQPWKALKAFLLKAWRWVCTRMKGKHVNY